MKTTLTLDPTSFAEERTARSFARHLPVAARLLLGAMFFVFGLNGFLNFIPPPSTPMPENVLAFVNGLMKSGYMFALISATELVVGALLLVNRFVSLALVIIAPVIVNIIAFHAFLEPSGSAIAAIVVVLEVYLAWSYRAAYRPLLAPRVTAA